jgi:abhydrolase domain-containing protein 17
MQRATLKKWAKRIVLDILIICVVQYLIMLAICLFFMDGMMFAPHPAAYTWQTPCIIDIGSPGEPLAAYWRSSTNATVTILHSHGNAEEIGDLTEFFDSFAQSNMNILAYDYPGYGLSAGKPTEKSCYEAAERAYAFLTQKQGIPPSSIIVLGRSLGSGPACYMAEKYQVKGLILESGFLSAPRVVTRYRILPVDAFPNAKRIPRITCPKLFIHGTADPVIPFWHGKHLYGLSIGAKEFYWVQGGGHNDLQAVIGVETYTALIKKFAEQ